MGKRAASLLIGVIMPVTPVHAQDRKTDDQQVLSTSDGQDDIIVMGSAYIGNVATGGARIAAPIRDLPLSITSLNEQLIEDRQVRNIRQLADNVAGVQSRAGGGGDFTLDFDVRGLQGTALATNGFRNAGITGQDPSIVDRVEFLKGPASVLYGASSLSGLVNVVTKTPQRDNFVVVEGTGGQFDYGRGSVDANAALSDALQVRVNGAIDTARRLGSFTRTTSRSIAPTVAWTPLPGVKLVAEYDYFYGRQGTRTTNSRLNTTRLLNLPIDFKLGDRGDRDILRSNTYRGEASWDITPTLTLRQGALLNDGFEDELDIPGFARDIVGDTYLRNQDGAVRGSRDFSSQTELRWSVSLWGMRHKLLLGFEHSYSRYGLVGDQSQPFPDLDLNNPVYGYPTQPRLFGFEFVGITTGNAPYLQDFIEIGRRFKVLAGLRYDRTKTGGFECDTALGCSAAFKLSGNSGAVSENAVSPRLGVAWQPTDRTTVYVSYSKSFVPSASLDRNGRILPGERGKQYEVGVRQDLVDQHRLTLTLSAYNLTRQNIAESDPIDDRFSIAIGEQRVRGVEAELAGKPVPWIDIIASYSHIDGKVTKSETALTGIPVGIQLPEVPRNTASLFSKVTLTPLALDDTSIGIGVYYTGDRPIREYFFPYYDISRFGPTTRVDLSLYQNVGTRVRLQANITNLFDQRIFEPGNVGSYRALPFTATAGVRVTL